MTRKTISRPWTFGAAVSIALTALLGLPFAEPQVGTIRTHVDLVLVPASVRDSRGNLISGLGIQDFELKEDGKPQLLANASIDTSPPAVEVVRDSGMFQGVFMALSESVESFLSAFREPDPQGIDGSRIRDLNDALYATASYLEQRSPNRRKIIVAAVTGPPSTDPGARRSTQVLDHLVESEVQVYFILAGHFFPSAPAGRLHAYADPTGGAVYNVTDQREMTEVLSQIDALLHHQYILSYVSNNRIRGSAPVVRKIEVKVRRPDSKVTYRHKYLQFP